MHVAMPKSGDSNLTGENEEETERVFPSEDKIEEAISAFLTAARLDLGVESPEDPDDHAPSS